MVNAETVKSELNWTWKRIGFSELHHGGNLEDPNPNNTENSSTNSYWKYSLVLANRILISNSPLSIIQSKLFQLLDARAAMRIIRWIEQNKWRIRLKTLIKKRKFWERERGTPVPLSQTTTFLLSILESQAPLLLCWSCFPRLTPHFFNHRCVQMQRRNSDESVFSCREVYKTICSTKHSDY